MNYINRNTGDMINNDVYNQLSDDIKSNFIKSESIQKTHQIIETKSDNLSIGDGIATAVLLPIAAILSIFD